MSKIDVLIVTEYADDTILSNTIFPIFDRNKKGEVVSQAEKAFGEKAKEKGLNDDELSDALDEGMYESGDYQVFLAWSDIEVPV